MLDPAHNGHETIPPAPTPQNTAPISHNARAYPSGPFVAFRGDVEDIMAQEILEVPFADFQESYLPNPKILTDDLVQKCAAALKVDERSFRSPSQESNVVASSRSPFKAASSEKVFNVLLDICKAITKAGVGPPTTTLVSRSTELSTEEDINSYRIGSFFKLLDTTTSDFHSCGEIAVNLECRLLHDESDLRENRRRLVGAAVHVMNNDPRRRHTYSISIEDNIMRVWFFSRSYTMRSQAINILKDYDEVIHILAAFLFASTEELGYDPDIRKHNDDQGDSFFVFRIDTRYFKTLSCIHDYQPSHIATRATRVWKAIEIASFEALTPLHGAVEVVLKDYWLTESSLSEREIQTAVFKALEEVRVVVDLSGFHEDLALKIRCILDAGSWNQYFLTIEVDARDAMPHPAPKTAALTNTIFDSNVRGHVEPGLDSARSQVCGHLPALADYNSREGRSFAEKTRCQVVYKEVCIPIDGLNDSCQVVETMESCLIGSALMFLANYMHRDLSAANLLFFPTADDGPSGKIGDLEYAKQFGVFLDGAKSDPKTGTPLFMSVEIHTGSPIDTVPPSAVPWTAKVEDVQVANMSCHVHHNFQHDCESYWWLAVWFLYQLKGTDTKKFRDIFRASSSCSDQRRSSYMAEGYLLNEGGGLRALFPDNLRDEIWKVEIARRNLRAYNHERIKDGKTNEILAYVMPFNEIYVLIVNSLRPISKVSSLPTISDANTVSSQQGIPLKRKNDDGAYVPDSPSDRITGSWSGDRRTTRSSNKRIRGG